MNRFPSPAPPFWPAPSASPSDPAADLTKAIRLVERYYVTPLANAELYDTLDLKHLPMTVLIDGKSVSAAEILAAALGEHGRATLVGSQSYGKGCIQTILPLDRERALLVTTAYYLTPQPRSWNDRHRTGTPKNFQNSWRTVF